MTWLDAHQLSERLASDAADMRSSGRYADSVALYLQAADFELQALSQIDPAATRTLGIIAVSAAALLFKADAFYRAEAQAIASLNDNRLPPFAHSELRLILQNVWVALAKHQAGVRFIPGQVVISVKGGDVVTGGAPLDLIVEKVQLVQSMFYRTIEHIRGLPLRTRGQPSKDILEACQPWLFQEAPSSYQFSVAVREPEQPDFFGSDIEPATVATHFLTILKAAVNDPTTMLPAVVPQREYRAAFLKLSRGLTPSKTKRFDTIEIRISGEQAAAQINPETRNTLNQAIKREEDSDPRKKSGEPIDVRGTLRAVHLDKDWIEIADDGKSVRVVGLKDSVDDLIGPLVNRQVIVRAMKQKQRIRFLDIEAED